MHDDVNRTHGYDKYSSKILINSVLTFYIITDKP